MKKILFLFSFFSIMSHISCQNKADFIQPDFLSVGDTILIVAPAGVVKSPNAILQAKTYFEKLNYKVEIGKHVFKKHHHFAGSDTERLEDMQWALNHPTAKAIWCARGGYGSVRIIDALDFTTFRKKPKWLIGYSDFTVFHSHIHQLGIESIHGPMAINFQTDFSLIEESITTLQNTLQGNLNEYKIKSNPKNKIGTAKGILIGGNLTLLDNMIGTPSCVNTTKNKILFIEEIGEYKYHLDRMLRALDRYGYFKNCNGIIFGDFSLIKKNNPTFGQSMEDLILEIVDSYNIPVAFDFPAGHEPKNLSLIFGKEIELHIEKDTTTLKYSY